MAAHDCYLSWLHDEKFPEKKNFMAKVKNWLSYTPDINENEIIDLNKAIAKKMPFKDYKIIKWGSDVEVDHETEISLLNYVEGGGSIENYKIFLKINMI